MLGWIAKKKLGIKVKHDMPMVSHGTKLEEFVATSNCSRSNPIITKGEVNLILENEGLKRVSANKVKHEINKVEIGTQKCNPHDRQCKGAH